MEKFFYGDQPSFGDLLVAVYFAAIFGVAHSFFDRFVFRRLFFRLLSHGAAPLRLDDTTLGKILKCSESSWKLAYYITIEACLLTIAYNEPWFWNSKEYFTNWPNQEMRISLKLIYMCQCGFYLYSIPALLTWETRRKDFFVMLSHHIVTIILIGVSYLTGFFRIGAVVLGLHDASDVFLEAAKLCKYCGKQLAASVFFGGFAVSWFILRLIIFPFWIIKSSSYDLCQHLNLSEAYDTQLYYTFNTFLLTLFILHIYWWILICSVIMKQLKNKGQVGEDVRSDSEDD